MPWDARVGGEGRTMPRGSGRRYQLLNHVHGLPYDPPRWGEQPRLRLPKKSFRQGAGTTVAVLDSGASEHEWLLGSFAEDPLPDSARELWDLSVDALPRQVGHGTFVCGVVLQYAPAATLLPRRAIDMYGDAYDEQLAEVVRSLVPHDPDVVNLSLGPTPADQAGETDEGVAKTMAALYELQERCGTVVVAAAGDINEELPCERLAPPGPLSLIVGALDLSGQPAWFSGVKPVTIWAPGVDVLSSFVHYDGPVSLAHPDDHPHRDGHAHPAEGHTHPEGEQVAVQQPVAPFVGWARWNGTSFAAPAVSGAIAAEISALAEDGTDRRELRRRAVERVLERARPVTDGGPAATDGATAGIALSAAPVALMGPPLG
jgi:subtilisin family serine protease